LFALPSPDVDVDGNLREIRTFANSRKWNDLAAHMNAKYKSEDEFNELVDLCIKEVKGAHEKNKNINDSASSQSQNNKGRMKMTKKDKQWNLKHHKFSAFSDLIELYTRECTHPPTGDTEQIEMTEAERRCVDL